MSIVLIPSGKLCVYTRSLRKNDHAVDKMAALFKNSDLKFRYWPAPTASSSN